MGTWDFGPFDNDDAADWIAALERSTDTSTLRAALSAITEIGDEYLEAPDCCNALAAAEIIAALHGHPIASMSEDAQNWVNAHRGLDVSSLVPVAQTAVERIRHNSELKELWDESEDAAHWYATLNDVLSRLDLK